VNEDKASRYHRLKRQASVVSLLWGVLLLGGLIATGWNAALRDAAERIAADIAPASWSAAATVLCFVVLLSLLNEIAGLPLGFYSGFVLERQYELSKETLAGWLADQAKSFAIGVTLAAIAAELLYGFMRLSPDRWWLAAGLTFTLLIVGLTNLAPVLLLPIFYSVKPLDRDALRERLLALAERADARVLGAYEWGLGEKTKKANAALAGLGATRRILVSDTMLAEFSDDEIEVVLAHEIAHHVHGDIWKGIAFESTLILAGFYLASMVLRAMAGPAGLRGVDDVAGLPLLLLTAGAVSLVMMPAAHAMSRAFEREADRFALRLTRNPGAFISAMRRLGAQNLAEDDPSKIVQWLFYSHPPVRDRIAAAQSFEH
jgi:Zn-dependent protease with chaperone function